MAKRKTNKSEKIREQFEKNPDKPAGDVAKELKVQPSLVYQVRAKMKGKKPGRRKKVKRQKAAPASNHQSMEQVVAAAMLIKSCGSIEEAQEALKAAEKVGKAFEG